MKSLVDSAVSGAGSQALPQLSLERRLGELVRKRPITCDMHATVGEVLRLMQQHRVGSVIVLDARGGIAGIFTRKDVLSRVALPQTSPETPIASVMTGQVRSLTVDDTVEDAIMLGSRHGIRHFPVLEHGRVVNVISESDLFAIQRLSVKQLSSSARAANDLDELVIVARDIRALAQALLEHGVAARSLTAMISHLNDVLTARLLDLTARRHDLSLADACWLSFGSEGRSEQTISTDQDNGLIFASTDPARDRPRWLAFAREVNEGLDTCGYPLCKGNIMASNPECCLMLNEWRQRFAFWVERGTPEDLLKANIFFDFRALAGNAGLAEALRGYVIDISRDVTRFHKQLADDILRRRVPLTWLGRIGTERIGSQRVVDLKLRGTAIFVDVARLQSLALGIAETNTRARFEAIAQARKLGAQAGETWSSAFEFLQMLRLRVQLGGGGMVDGQPNKVGLAALNGIDRRMLKESLRVARSLQQRVELDYRV